MRKNRKQVSARVQKKWNPGALLVGMERGAAAVENGMAVPEK